MEDLSTEQAHQISSTQKQVEEFLSDIIDIVATAQDGKHVKVFPETDQLSFEELLSKIKTTNLFGASRINGTMGTQNLRFGAYPNSNTDFAFNHLAGESNSSMINDFDYLMCGEGFQPRPLPLLRVFPTFF